MTVTQLNQLSITDDGFIFDPSSGTSFKVNGTGLSIIHALIDNKSTAVIAEELYDGLNLTSNEVEKDIIDFVTALRAYGLVA